MSGKDFFMSLPKDEQNAIIKIIKIENTSERLKTKTATRETKNNLRIIIKSYSKEWEENDI